MFKSKNKIENKIENEIENFFEEKFNKEKGNIYEKISISSDREKAKESARKDLLKDGGLVDKKLDELIENESFFSKKKIETDELLKKLFSRDYDKWEKDHLGNRKSLKPWLGELYNGGDLLFFYREKNVSDWQEIEGENGSFFIRDVEKKEYEVICIGTITPYCLVSIKSDGPSIIKFYDQSVSLGKIKSILIENQDVESIEIIPETEKDEKNQDYNWKKVDFRLEIIPPKKEGSGVDYSNKFNEISRKISSSENRILDEIKNHSEKCSNIETELCSLFKEKVENSLNSLSRTSEDIKKDIKTANNRLNIVINALSSLPISSENNMPSSEDQKNILKDFITCVVVRLLEKSECKDFEFLTACSKNFNGKTGLNLMFFGSDYRGRKVTDNSLKIEIINEIETENIDEADIIDRIITPGISLDGEVLKFSRVSVKRFKQK